MTNERYIELEKNEELKLTKEEIDQGWFFCNCEWDGMLINKDGHEAQFCGCLQNELKYENKTPKEN